MLGAAACIDLAGNAERPAKTVLWHAAPGLVVIFHGALDLFPVVHHGQARTQLRAETLHGSLGVSTCRALLRDSNPAPGVTAASPMQPDRGAGPTGRPPAAMPIPGARPVAAGGGASADEWAVGISGTSGGGDTEASVDGASLQEGLFSTSMSLRRNTSDHGYGSLGHGHGAWLSSSPHPTTLRHSTGTANRVSRIDVRQHTGLQTVHF